jgi:predicted MPP superfamily phosphohydrolase
MKRKLRRRRQVLTVLGILGVSLMVYSILIEPNVISINTVPIADDDLFAILGDKKVVQISDLHITSIGYREKKLVAELNQLNPDILFITGDFLTNGKSEDACIEVLRQIRKPPHGIWIVLGNSDRQKEDGSEGEIGGFLERLTDLGVRVLENKAERLDIDDHGNHLFVVGIEGPYLSESKLDRLLNGIPDTSPIILLSHYPDIFENHADGLVINLAEGKDVGVSGWGWQDNAFFEYDTGVVRFEKDGRHRLRVQRREDGVAIEQIWLVKGDGAEAPISLPREMGSGDSATIHRDLNRRSDGMVIITAEDVSDSSIFGSWKKVHAPDGPFDLILRDTPDSGVKNEIPLLAPEHFFEADFYAKGGVDYHVWVRMKAEDDLAGNDSIYLQFSDSITEYGEPIYRIGELARRDKLRQIDLILAGHTHGGQVRFPIVGVPDIVPGHRIKFDMGLFENQKTKMYVNRGIGTALLPMRLFSPPEITVLEFRRVE